MDSFPRQARRGANHEFLGQAENGRYNIPPVPGIEKDHFNTTYYVESWYELSDGTISWL
jgi:hypothetical protein